MGEIKHGIDVFSSLAAPQISLKNLPPICDFYEMYTPSLQWAPLYPRQKTLMKLIFLELDQMTSYDFAVIEGVCLTFGRAATTVGFMTGVKS